MGHADVKVSVAARPVNPGRESHLGRGLLHVGR
jgi:hypothetical protein